ncbi:MAG: ATP synthase F0 subunit B [Lachnospiraceae bacterium]|nr:ATP synthase F0 subunit B [Lachnospiraceae bacterium]
MLRLDINLVFTIINLLIWYVLIRKFLFKPVNKIISQREAAIGARYEEAQKLSDEVQAAKQEYADFQTRMDEEKSRVIAEAQEEARAQYKQIVADAHTRADEIVEESQKEAKLQKERIIGKAQQEIRGLILDAAEQSLGSAQNDGALYDQFLAKAGEASHAES